MFGAMEQALAEHADEVAAVIVEPLVQCAGSMRMYHPHYLSLLREACDRHDVLLIADEIAVGFGRSGTMFACEQAGIRPDFICLSKGLTGGYLPLSVVVTTEPVYQAFYDDYERLNAFLHSHSYTGNPLACAAALATLDVLAEEELVARAARGEALLGAALRGLAAGRPAIREVRGVGWLWALELDSPARAKRLARAALDRGLLLLAGGAAGDTVQIAPPLAIAASQLELALGLLGESLKEACDA
jgi:adenosylmethionine-8-amino-7-oxononanoate aminotransferase